MTYGIIELVHINNTDLLSDTEEHISMKMQSKLQKFH